MPFEAYLPAGFSHNHENLMFDALARSLQTVCAELLEPHYLVGNVTFDGEELDGIFLKPNAISVIEMKNCGGMIHSPRTRSGLTLVIVYSLRAKRSARH